MYYVQSSRQNVLEQSRADTSESSRYCSVASKEWAKTGQFPNPPMKAELGCRYCTGQQFVEGICNVTDMAQNFCPSMVDVLTRGEIAQHPSMFKNTAGLYNVQ